MKKTTQSIFLMAILCLITQLFCCQAPPLEENGSFVVVEEMPRFPGCEDIEDRNEKSSCATRKLLEFVYGNLEYPEEARDEGVEGTVVTSFIVEVDGTLSNFELKETIGAGCDEEALRVVELMNDMEVFWIPGTAEDEPVKVEFNLPVRFKL